MACALGCSYISRSNIRHRFPNPKKYPSQYAAWMAVLPEYCKDIDYNIVRICNKHFLEKDKYNKRRIIRIAIPVLCLPGRPDTHNNCNCYGEMPGLHKDTESKGNKDEHSINITNIKHMSLSEREHDYAKPQKEARTLNYTNYSKKEASVPSRVPVNTKCDELQNTKDPTKVDIKKKKKFIDNYTVKETIKDTINDVSNQPQPVLNGADVTRVTKDTYATLSTSSVKTKENIILHHHNTNIEKTSRKIKVIPGRFIPTYKTRAVKEAIFSETFSEENKSTSTIPDTCFTKTNSEKLCVSKNTSSNSNQQLPCFKNADSRLTEISRNEKTKADTKPTHKLTCKSNPYKKPATPVNSDKVESKTYMLPKIKCNDLFDKLVTYFYNYKCLEPGAKDNLQKSKEAGHDAYMLGSYIFLNSKLRFTNKRFSTSNDNLVAKEDVCKQVNSKTTTKSNTSETNLEEICKSDYDTWSDAIDQQPVLSSNVEMVDKNIEKRSDNCVTVRICERSDTESQIHAKQPILCSDVEKVDKNIEKNYDNCVSVRIYYEESDTDTPLQSPKHAKQPILCSDVENVDQNIKTNCDNHVTLRIYEESDTGTPLQSPKRAKLHINELDEYRIVGSTTVYTGSLAQNDVQLLKDPLEVSPDIGIYCGGLIADIIKSEDEMSCVEGSIYSLEDNMEFVNDMSIREENIHLDDNIYPNYIDIIKQFDYYDIDLKVEIAYALKFMHKKGKSPDEAAKEILDMYGPDKMTVMEVEYWYQEFDLGNKVTSIIYSGGPVWCPNSTPAHKARKNWVMHDIM